MIDEQTADRITQKKLNFICATKLHVRQLAWLQKWNTRVDLAAIVVPLIYFVFRYLAKGTAASPYVETLWEILAVLLIAFVVCKIVMHWQEDAEKHSRLLGENISLVRQADNLLVSGRTTLSDGVQLFFALAEKTDIADTELLGQPSEKDRQFAYREGLKEMNIACVHCHTSPWDFISGSCQACGNTPQQYR